MRFGPVPVAEAEGAILAHSLAVAGRKMAKGRLLGAEDVAAIAREGIGEVTVARLDPDDVGEDAAALRLAQSLVGPGADAGLRLTVPHAGRVNLHAEAPGILDLDVAAVHALNLVDPAITFATLPQYTRLDPGQLAGTIKIIAYAVPAAALRIACARAARAVRARPVVLATAGLILTETDAASARLADKGRDAVAGRLRALGMSLAEVRSVPHDAAAIAGALGQIGGEMVMIMTGAATSDLHDVAPEALRLAGGRVARFGMPVDPGNLLFHGDLSGRPVIGLPGCARSPALNGADWVLERLACGITLSDADIAAMGVGGLLKEIPIRPAPRERKRPEN